MRGKSGGISRAPSREFLKKKASERHDVNSKQLREHLYTLKQGKKVDEKITAHILNCTKCQSDIRIMQIIDPVLNGEEKILKTFSMHSGDWEGLHEPPKC